MTWTSNVILKSLSAEDAALIIPKLTRVQLTQRQPLFESSEPIPHVHFLEGGLSSEIAVGVKEMEIGCAGFEGCTGVPVIMGVDASPHRAFMQAGGPSLRIDAEDLRELLDVSSTLRNGLFRYVHVFMAQVAANALANCRYEVEQRLARWILMGCDRLGELLPFTHEFLALMLGVRRPSVTDALHKLEGYLAIRADRGVVKVRDRSILEDVAGDAYGKPEAEYRRLIGPF